VVTTDQNRLNLRSAERLVAGELGVSADANALPYTLRVEFNRRLAGKILEFPSRFTAQTVATAAAIAGKTYEPLTDPSFSAADFARAVVDNAVALGDDIAEVGRGVARTANLAGWLIPAAALAAVGIYLWRLAKK